MIWRNKGGEVKLEEGEPALRSCWECNSAHEHLKKVNSLHYCFDCGRFWIFDRFMDTFADGELDDYLESLGLQIGESTTKVDHGYRIGVIICTPKDGDDDLQ